MQSPYTTSLSPPAARPYGRMFAAHELDDFSCAGFLKIIDRLERSAHNTAWARDALVSERRAFMIIHGFMQGVPESPLRSFEGVAVYA